MSKIVSLLILVSVLLLTNGCAEDHTKNEKKDTDHQAADDSKASSYDFDIKSLTDDEYPDNPNIGHRSKKHDPNYFQKGSIDYKKDFLANFHFFSEEDTTKIMNFNLSEFIPTIPKRFTGNDYLCKIAVVNQEWNRNQVKLTEKTFSSTDDNIVRVDISRNCLNAYLWEVIAYTEENGEVLPIYHGWFDFPKELYADLFEQKNDVDYAKYKKPLEHWVDPENKTFDIDVLRTVESEIEVDYADKSDAMYPLKGARLKKYKEVITPDTFQTMRDLQSDSTTFATFSQPGFYNKKDPRHTELGRFYHLEDITMSKTSCNDKNDLREIKLTFLDKHNKRITHLYFGGLDFDQFPKLSEEQANSGWKNSMGFGNHPFYQNYEEFESWNLATSCYYGFLTNGEQEWLDSHKVGIDGPIIHWDDEVENRLHIWLLSFERHALVGHYVINIQ